MPNLITVGMSEMKDDSFKVLAYEREKERFISLTIDEIHDGKEYKWDYFGQTVVEKLIDPNGRGELCKVTGDSILKKCWEKDKMKRSFERHRITLSQFSRDKSKLYAIIKVDELESINSELDTFKHTIKFISKGMESGTVKMKDYRWVQYWNEIIKQGKYEEKKKHFEEYLKDTDKDIYVVMYRHNYRGKDYSWVAGFHCL